MLRWERKDNQHHEEDVDCFAAYGDDNDIATSHLYAPGKSFAIHKEFITVKRPQL